MIKITVENLDMEEKKREFKEKMNYKLQKTKDWFSRNKEAVIVLTPIVIGTATTIFKTVGKRINLGKEQDLKELYCYDRSLGHYWRLNRRLSNREWTDIESRRKAGERLGDILSSMNVLK